METLDSPIVFELLGNLKTECFEAMIAKRDAHDLKGRK
jgi:hypothetical protein